MKVQNRHRERAQSQRETELPSSGKQQVVREHCNGLSYTTTKNGKRLPPKKEREDRAKLFEGPHRQPVCEKGNRKIPKCPGRGKSSGGGKTGHFATMQKKKTVPLIKTGRVHVRRDVKVDQHWGKISAAEKEGGKEQQGGGSGS